MKQTSTMWISSETDIAHACQKMEAEGWAVRQVTALPKPWTPPEPSKDPRVIKIGEPIYMGVLAVFERTEE